MVKKKNSQVTSEALVDLKNQLARALADYDNLRKRVEREKEEGKYITKMVVVSRLLPVFDMFTDAQKHSGDPGLGIALKVLEETLKDEGITEIQVSEGDPFNHELHEAVDTVATNEKEDDTVAQLALKGYKFIDGPVIRHAKVTVYKKEKNN